MRLRALFAIVCLAAAAAVSACGAEWAWTTAKAEAVVRNSVTLRLPERMRVSLGAELRAQVALYRTLENTAAVQEGKPGHERLASLIHNMRYRFSTALKRVQRGLEVDTAACTGMGAAAPRNRFERFRCAATSVSLHIPSPTVIWEDDRITDVVEQAPRRIGPIHARLDVDVTGKSTIAYRQIGS
jgi:hypothetical protein